MAEQHINWDLADDRYKFAVFRQDAFHGGDRCLAPAPLQIITQSKKSATNSFFGFSRS